MLTITVLGAAGRMGRELVRQIADDSQLKLVGAIEAVGAPAVGLDAGRNAGIGDLGILISDDPDDVVAETEVILDFSSQDSVIGNARKAIMGDCAIVVGTTGLSSSDKGELQSLAENGGRLVFAPNMSIGVNLLFLFSEQAARVLDEDYDIEIVEMHHNQKKDAPSGTAVRLGEILASVRGLEYGKDVLHGRHGMIGERKRREIGMHSLRGGDVVGDHKVIFATGGERFELAHKASNRGTFAKGALRAAKFIAEATPGLYDMQDVLGFKADG